MERMDNTEFEQQLKREGTIKDKGFEQKKCEDCHKITQWGVHNAHTKYMHCAWRRAYCENCWSRDRCNGKEGPLGDRFLPIIWNGHQWVDIELSSTDDPIGEFLAHHCDRVVDQEDYTPCNQLYESYCEWFIELVNGRALCAYQALRRNAQGQRRSPVQD